MNISTDLDQISPVYDKAKAGYEWWYFDGMSNDGVYSFVIIFYHDNPFSTKKIKELLKDDRTYKNHPAVSVSVYENNKPVYYSFLEFESNAFHWDKNDLRLTIENLSVQYSLSEGKFELELNLDQELPSGHRIKGNIAGTGSLPSAQLIESDSEDNHLWNLILPVMDIEADLSMDGKRGEKRLKFTGKGYHDHNIGNEPMKESFRDWYWGRYHFRDFTLVYYLMQKNTEREFKAWLIDSNNESILEKFNTADLSYYSRNWFGLNSARKIDLTKGEVIVNINCKDKIDDGPFYQRFIGNSVIKYNGQVNAAHGISEYIFPKNIYKRLFWPLVHMRLRYLKEEPHWVQKSRLLYPWTW
ncbi:hypothetical protein [Gracilimonas sp.]|uniref:hypothetical protein n=1 Tax=Gracilimonas sp. TaxID=1974203 RepID=UPI00287265AD|nr:hypothetical protein [Gracilimonas sp.]